MTTNSEAKAALEAQRIEKQAEIDALMAQLQEEQEDLNNLDTAMSGLDSQSSGDTNVNVTVPVPQVNVDVPETVINVNVPEVPAPDVHVDAHVHPNISLNMPEGSIVTELSGTGIAEAIANAMTVNNAMLLQRLEEVRQDLRAVARAADVNIPGLLNGDTSSNS